MLVLYFTLNLKLSKDKARCTTVHGLAPSPIALNIGTILLQYCFSIFPIFANVASTLHGCNHGAILLQSMISVSPLLFLNDGSGSRS